MRAAPPHALIGLPCSLAEALAVNTDRDEGGRAHALLRLAWQRVLSYTTRSYIPSPGLPRPGAYQPLSEATA